jgi:glycerol uptake facilitator-like aquaporin
MLVFTVLATTNPQTPVALAGVAIGLVLTLIHLVGIPVTNTSVKPGAQHGAGYGRRRMGGRTALDALGSASRPSVSRPRSATRS